MAYTKYNISLALSVNSLIAKNNLKAINDLSFNSENINKLSSFIDNNTIVYNYSLINGTFYLLGSANNSIPIPLVGVGVSAA